MKTYYKVFRKSLDKKSRNGIDSSVRKTVIDYKQGEYISAPEYNSRLFVFDSIDAVKQYLNVSVREYIVYECNCKGVIKNANGFIPSTSMGTFKSFWETINKNLKNKKKWNHGIREDFNLYYHDGVCFAKEVKLIKPIKI
jgi:hypothetical protein